MLGENWNENHEHVDGKSKDEHKEQPSAFSKYLLNSVYKENEEVEVYGKILPTNTGELRQISIISQKMMDYDKAFLNTRSQEEFPDKLNIRDYHPYACEFFVTTWKKDDEKNKKLTGKWFSVKLIFGELMKKCKCQGILVFSASPILRIKCGIEFFAKHKTIQDTDIEKYVHDNIKTKGNDAEKYFFENIQNMGKVSGSIYNVGQGNFTFLNFNDEKTMLFDVGETMIPNIALREPEIIEANIKEIKKYSLIILFFRIGIWIIYWEYNILLKWKEKVLFLKLQYGLLLISGY